MMNDFYFSNEEALLLESILAPLSKKAGYTLILPLLIEKWENFVSEVEEGYTESIYDYTNDLSIRDTLQLILDNIPINFPSRLYEWINNRDNRFFNATTQVKKPLLPLLGIKEIGWWWFRIPRYPGDELKNDLDTWS